MVLTSILAATLAAPQFATPQAPARSVYTTVAQSGKKVSLRFDEASLKDVLKGLEKQKIDFVVDAESFKDRRISLNLNDVPVNVALEAVASALGAHWEAVGSVRVLKKGAGFGQGLSGMFENGGFRTFEMPKGFDGKIFQGEPFKGQKFDFKGLQGAPNLEFRKLYGTDGAYKSLSPKEAEEFRKAMERIRGEGGKNRTEIYRLEGDRLKALEGIAKNRVEVRGLFDDATRKALEKAKSDSKLQKLEVDKILERSKGSVNLEWKGLDALVKSITPEQKELAKKQGYLKVSDLTAEQRKIAGIKEGGQIEISITRAGETLKIKGE